jgi:phosphoribosyl 1,2-cyclic phosphodiesterase
VYATKASWESLVAYDLDRREVVTARQPVEISGITFEAFPVLHSTRAPAVGYRVTAGQVTIFYVPDVVWIEDREGALGGAGVYVGDGATATRSMVRKIDHNLVGHTPLRTQLTWCQKEGVPRAIFTHCGAEIVKGDPDELSAEVDALAEERGVEADIAYDGMEVVLR